MKTITNTLLLIVLGAFNSAFAQSPINATWAFNEGKQGYDYEVLKSAVDANNNLYIAGRTHLNFNATSTTLPPRLSGLSSNSIGISQDHDVLFLAKYNSNGVLQWTIPFEFKQSYNTPIRDGWRDIDWYDFDITGISINESNGHVFVTGNFLNNIRFNSTNGTAAALSTPNTKIKVLYGYESNEVDPSISKDEMYTNHFYVAEYSPSGERLNTFTDGGDKAFTFSNDVEVDNQGNVYVTGYFYGEKIQFGQNGGISFNTLTPYQTFYLEDDPSSSLNPPFYASNYYPLHGQGTRAFLAKYQANGELNWIQLYEGDYHTLRSRHKGLKICLDDNNNPVMLGSYVMKTRPSSNMGVAIPYDVPHNVDIVQSNDLNGHWLENIFMAKHSASNGAMIWHNSVTKAGVAHVNLESDDNGNVILTGHSRHGGAGLDFNSANGTVTSITNPGRETAFVANYTKHGNLNWVNRIFSTYRLEGLTVENQKILIAGNYFGFSSLNNWTLTQFEGQTNSLSLQGSSTQKGMYFAEYDMTGNPTKAFREGNANHRDISLAARNGTIYVATNHPQPNVNSYFDGDGISGDTLYPTAQGGSNDQDITLIKYSNCSSYENIRLRLGMRNGTVRVLGNAAQLLVSGGNYQWYRNGNIIPGATNSTYVPTQPGSYTLEVTNAKGCVITSGIYLHNLIGPGDIKPLGQSGQSGSAKSSNQHISSETFDMDIQVSPNPNNGTFTLGCNFQEKGSGSIIVTNYLGQSVYVKPIELEKGVFSKELSLDHLTPGMYFLTLQNKNQKWVKHLIIE